MAYVQKYRDFAKKHPVAQSLIYGALIAAAGISGAGAGGAAALGLFKMVDKLLQGEKFSSAAYSGAKTGAMAYAAGQIGKAIKGDQAPTGSTGTDDISARWEATQAEVSKDLLKRYTPVDFDYVPSGDDVNIIDKATGQLVSSVSIENMGPGVDPETFIASMGQFGKAASSEASKAARDAANAAVGNFESRDLSHKQVIALFERVAHLNSRMLSEGRLEEGIWDDIKSGAGKGLQGIKSLAGKAAGAVAQGAAKVGRSMTANVSSDALTKAWQAAGSPTDSVEIEKLLQAQGVNPEVVKTVFQANSIPLSVAAAASTGSAGVDANEPMPDVMSTNRAETPAPIEPATASAGPGAQVAQQQAPQQTIQQPASAEPATSPAGQGAVAQGVQQAQSQQQQPSVTASKLPDVSKLTPEQKKQLLALVDKQLTSMPVPKATPQPATKTTKPKVPYSAIQPTAQKISAPPKPGAPTPAEQAKLQQRIQSAMAAQQQP
jgi:hypothetical protein